MNRIDTIVSLINDNDLVADIGCDQVEVGIKLAKRGIKSIASDISDNVIKKAKEKVKTLGLEDYIDLRTSNGLNKINDNEVNTLVIAGMGAYTIIDILNTNKRFNKIITISNNHNDLIFGILFSMVAGIMVFVSLDELLPASQRAEDHHISVYGAILGMIVMAIALNLLGGHGH